MKRILFPLCAAIFGAAAATAHTAGVSAVSESEPSDDFKAGYGSVVIVSQSGETTTVTLSDDMKTTFTDHDISFADATTTVSLPLAKLRSYSFVEAVVPEGIDAIPALTGATTIFSADGRRVPTLVKGLNIVKNGSATIKIYKH